MRVSCLSVIAQIQQSELVPKSKLKNIDYLATTAMKNSKLVKMQILVMS